MSAWFIGRYKSIEEISKDIEIRPLDQGELKNAFELTTKFGSGSVLKVIISLDAGSKVLNYSVCCDWREFGSEERGIPNLHFHLPLAYKPNYLFDIPFGMTERKARDQDLPAESFVMAGNPGGKSSLALYSLDKYGYRCLDDSLALTLIRGSINPDPTPETGRHNISFAIAPVSGDKEELTKESLLYRRPVTVISGKKRKPELPAKLPAETSFFSLKGGVLSGVKVPEKGGKKLIFRIYEALGKETAVELNLSFAANAAWLTDVTEDKRLEDCSVSDGGKKVSFKLPAYSVRALMIELK
jgi:alpha-mannosidase